MIVAVSEQLLTPVPVQVQFIAVPGADKLPSEPTVYG
jgi:hypothetical protein